tara:strand:- start:871 stop:978 length:108 start_codon:yes stop_codon:yes gene_type:complete
MTTKDLAEFFINRKNLQFMQSGIGKSLMLDKVFMD